MKPKATQEQHRHQAATERQVQRYTQRRAEHGRHHRQGQQPVGVAQHVVLHQSAAFRQIVSFLHVDHN
jgi:hypothetical protein